jgi:heme/copper-type cytochrome/quinol oxidase subunit 2
MGQESSKIQQRLPIASFILMLLTLLEVYCVSNRFQMIVQAESLNISAYCFIPAIFVTLVVLIIYRANPDPQDQPGASSNVRGKLTLLVGPGITVFFLLKTNFLLVNGLFDPSSPVVHQVTVTALTNEYNFKDRRGGDYVKFVHWDQPYKLCSVAVSHDFYESQRIGETMTVTTKKGYWGYEWLQDCK